MLSNSILSIEIANPILVTIVNPVPTKFLGAVSAFKVENCGESATTVNPQMRRTEMNNTKGRSKRKIDNKQQIPETNKNR